MKNTKRWFLVLFLLSGCANLTAINELPNIVFGEASFYPTLAAHTDASIIAGNRVELLFNGDQIFPAMLEAIRSARKSITYQQYFFEDGAIAHEIAAAFAERCRAGVQVKILLDSLGGGNIPKEIPALWKEAGCPHSRHHPHGCSGERPGPGEKIQRIRGDLEKGARD